MTLSEYYVYMCVYSSEDQISYLSLKMSRSILRSYDRVAPVSLLQKITAVVSVWYVTFNDKMFTRA